jgi:hypothetical protein
MTTQYPSSFYYCKGVFENGAKWTNGAKVIEFRMISIAGN